MNIEKIDINSEKKISNNLTFKKLIGEFNLRIPLFLEAFDGVVLLDKTFKITDTSKSIEHLFYFKTEDLIGRKLSDLMTVSSQFKFQTKVSKFSSETYINQEFEFVCRDLTVRTIELKLIPIYRDRTIIAYLGINRDVTEIRKMQENLELQQIALESTINGIVITNKSGDIIWTNKAFKKLSGYEQDELIYKKMSILDSGKHSKEFFKDLWDTILAGKKWKGELINKKKNGELYDELQTITPVLNKNEIAFFIAVKQDITEQKLAKEREKIQQEQLIQADKMVALGTLVSGVAHEINNPNNFVMLNVPLLRKTWESIIPILDEYYEREGDFNVGNRLKYSKIKNSIPVLLEGISDGAKRIKRIVEELKDFARHEPEALFEEVDVNKAIKAAVTLINNIIKKSTSNFKMDLEDNLPKVNGNFQQIEQVIINLIQNSCHALQNSSKSIIIKSEFLAEENMVAIKVIDEGIGINSSNLKKIMDPFFTTKRDIGGTGLGLSVSSKIIINHNGTLDFESEVGKGTTATIKLPVIEN